MIEHLGQLDFAHAKQNVILLGPPGTGKTHISIAIGIRACLAGHRVIFKTATEWVAFLADDRKVIAGQIGGNPGTYLAIARRDDGQPPVTSAN